MKDERDNKDTNNTLTQSELQELKKGFTHAEVNFLQFPIGSLDKRFKGQMIVFKDRIPFGDRTIDMEWEVTGNSKYGIPGPSAVDLDHAISKLIQEPARRINSLPPKWIKTTYHELAKETRSDTSGRTYKRIKRDLLKLRTVSIVSRGAYKQKNTPSPYDVTSVSKYQAIILKGQPAESWIPKDQVGENGLVEHVYILLSDMYWTSLNEHYTKPINYDYMMSLANPTLKRIYELLSLAFSTRMKADPAGIQCVNYNYQEFCGRMPIKVFSSAFTARQTLKRLFTKMVDAGYVSRYEFEFKSLLERWFIRVYPGPRAIEELELIRGQRLLFDQLDSINKINRVSRKSLPKALLISEPLGDPNSEESKSLMAKFDALPDQVKRRIEERGRILRIERYKGFGSDKGFSLLEAITEYFNANKN